MFLCEIYHVSLSSDYMKGTGVLIGFLAHTCGGT